MTNQRPPSDQPDPIRAAWASQPESDQHSSLPKDVDEFADALAVAHRKEQRSLVWLNFRESGASFFVTAVFLALTSEAGRPEALVLAAAIYAAVGLFLIINSIRHHRSDGRWGASVREQIDRRLAQLNHRAKLYQHSTWWYAVPLTVGYFLALFAFGLEEAGVSGVIFVVLGLLTIAPLYLVVRLRNQARYNSEIERLNGVLADFDRSV